MKICIICSLSKEKECKKTTKRLTSMGFEVCTPFDYQTSTSLYLVQKQYLNVIESCDIVLVIPKFIQYDANHPEHIIVEDYSRIDFTVGESVSYEIAYARKIGKPVIFGMLPFVEEKEKKDNEHRNDEVLCEGSLSWKSMETKSIKDV